MEPTKIEGTMIERRIERTMIDWTTTFSARQSQSWRLYSRAATGW